VRIIITTMREEWEGGIWKRTLMPIERSAIEKHMATHPTNPQA
jgi:hypothetical protein